MKSCLCLIIALLASITVPAQTVQSNMPAVNKKVYTIVRYNNTVYIGGDFDSVGTEARSRLAAIDANTGVVLPWNPGPNGIIRKLLITGNRLVVQGGFNTISGVPRQGLAVYDLTNGQLLSSSIPGGATGYGALAQKDNYVYYLGYDTAITTVMRFDINTLQKDPNWQGDYDPDIVNSMAILGNHVYVGGQVYVSLPFPATPIRKLCRYRISDGNVDTNFRFTFNSSGYVETVLGHSNGKLYVTGNFNLIDGITRKGIAEFDPAGNGSLTSTNIYCSNQYNIALAEQGNTIWIGGNSVAIGGINRYTIAQVDLHTQIATCWYTQQLSGNVYHYCIFPHRDTVYVGVGSGNMKTFNGNPGIIHLGNDTVICPGGSITLTAPAGLSGYYWSNGATTPTITVTTPGNYWVSVNAPSGCLYSGTRVIGSCTGLPTANSESSIKINPTLSTGLFHLTMNQEKFPTRLTVHDLNGRIINEQIIPPNTGLFTFDLSNKAPGLYLLRAVNEHEISTQTIVKY